MLLLVACSWACGGAAERPIKAAGSVLWIEPATVSSLDPERVDQLRQAGIRELFLEGAEMRWEGSQPTLTGEPVPRSLPRAPVTLVIRGPWPRALADDAEVAAAGLDAALDRLRLQAEGQGILPVGFHFAPAAGEPYSLASLAAVLSARQGTDLFLSIEIPPRTLGTDEAAEAVRAADFVVANLLGQRPEEAERPEAWRSADADAAVAALEALGARYLVGVVTLGAAYRLGGDGERVAMTTQASPKDLVRHRALERTRARLLEGWDRRVLGARAVRATELAGWKLAKGEKVEAIQLLPVHLIDLRDRLRFDNLSGYLGESYYRLPRTGEGLSLAVADLVDALTGVTTEPHLEISIPQRQTSGETVAFRVWLRNLSERSTDVAFYDQNYVEVTVEGGVVVDVAPGEFERYAFEQDGLPIRNMRALRSANGVKLFVPIVEGGDAVRSGTILVRGRPGRPPALIVGGRFLLPGGGEMTLARRAVAQ